MQWTPGGLSDDLEDRRNESGGGGGGGFGGGRLGIGGILIVGLLSLIFRHNFFTLFSGDATAPQAVRSAPHRQPAGQRDPQALFMSFVLDDTQRNWDQILPRDAGVRYRHAKLVLFRDAYPSGCGMAQDATGPFYCPEDEKVYLDLGFFDELKTRFGASNGEFAQAYVVAHEIGHHVQKVLGIEPKVHALQQQRPRQANQLSVALELQADCFAGVWGNSTATPADRYGRCPIGPQRGGGGGRRSHSENVDRRSQPGTIHTRFGGAAHHLVSARSEFRQDCRLRYVQSALRLEQSVAVLRTDSV
jgi:uncharacterized protein